MNRAPIYLDANATTPLDPRIRDYTFEVFTEIVGNPASGHPAGQLARTVIELARARLAELIDAHAEDVYFASSATSALNVGILGLARHAGHPFHILTTAVEHKAVYDAIRVLTTEGKAEVTVLPVDSSGRVRLPDVIGSIKSTTLFAVVQHGNNEMGALQPIKEISQILHSHGIYLMVDASQSLVCESLSSVRDGCDLIVGSSHKMHGPKGAAFIYARAGAKPLPLCPGSCNEGGLHLGTLNVPAIAGMGLAALLAAREGVQRRLRLQQLAELFLGPLFERIVDVKVNGPRQGRLPTNLSLTIPGITTESLQQRVPHLSFSRGSACSSLSAEPHHVLRAIGMSESEVNCTFRIGLNFLLAETDARNAGVDIAEAVLALRGTSAYDNNPNLNKEHSDV